MEHWYSRGWWTGELDQAVVGLVSHDEGWPPGAEECRLGLCFKPLVCWIRGRGVKWVRVEGEVRWLLQQSPDHGDRDMRLN